MVQFNYTNLSMVKKMSFLLVSLATILILCSFSNSQELANMDVNVDNYEQNYWGKNFDIVRFEILDDDPIVNLVDKKYFLEPQNELIIKDDYAFFITTKSMSSSLNLSTVGLIKINISTNLESVDSPSQIVERIEPIFQGDFYTINFGNDSRYIINNKNYFNESNLSTVVMPIQSLVGFKKNDDFYLTDFNFYGNLANIQHLNSINDNYIPEEDYGSFFTRSDIYFDGYAYNSNFKYCEFKGTIKLYSPGDFAKNQENVAVGSIAGLIYSGSIKYSTFAKGSIIAFMGASNNYDVSDDGEYIPYIGNMAGLSRYGTDFVSNYYNKNSDSSNYGVIDTGVLHSWSAWFQSWNQLANTNLYGDCGKVE